jgi:hypothetical protein
MAATMAATATLEGAVVVAAVEVEVDCLRCNDRSGGIGL